MGKGEHLGSAASCQLMAQGPQLCYAWTISQPPDNSPPGQSACVNRPISDFMPCALPHPAAEVFFLLQEPWEVVIPISYVQ